MSDLDEPGSGVSGEEAAASDAAGARRPRKQAPKRRFSALREAVIVVGIALVLSLLIKTFLVQAFYIPSESMETTLDVGDRVLVSRLAPGPLEVNRGDIVVFVDPGGWLGTSYQAANPVQDALIKAGEFVGLLPANTGSHLIKRVIGTEGDRVTCCTADGLLTVNGVAIQEPYVIAGAAPSTVEFDITVPADSYWVMGDNRPNSTDSRFHLGNPGGGSIPEDNVVGVAKATMWPLDRWTILRNPGATFADVPDPE